MVKDGESSTDRDVGWADVETARNLLDERLSFTMRQALGEHLFLDTQAATSDQHQHASRDNAFSVQ